MPVQSLFSLRNDERLAPHDIDELAPLFKTVVPERARDRAIEYLNGYFAEDDPISEEDVEVWRAEMDDDFNESFPYALAVSY